MDSVMLLHNTKPTTYPLSEFKFAVTNKNHFQIMFKLAKFIPEMDVRTPTLMTSLIKVNNDVPNFYVRLSTREQTTELIFECSCESIVMSACRNPVTDDIIIGFRHFDRIMRGQIDKFVEGDINYPRHGWDEGFISSNNKFYTREEAYKLSADNGQFFMPERSEVGTAAYSENYC